MTRTFIRPGVAARQVETPGAVFDVDEDGVILGVQCAAGADWARALLVLAMSGKVRLA